MKKTIKAKLVEKKDGLYSNYVFQNLNVPSENEYYYITVTVCPRWQDSFINKGEIGYLQYDFVQADEEYFDVSENKIKKYKYTSNYFINFIRENNIKDDKKEYNF